MQKLIIMKKNKKLFLLVDFELLKEAENE